MSSGSLPQQRKCEMTERALRILLVDDEPIKCQILKDTLEDNGHHVALARSPLEADGILDGESFDLIVSDIRMPGKDGITFLSEIKQRNPDQPVIIMTAFGTVDCAVEAMKLGAFDFLQKPFSAEEFLLKLDRLVQYEGLLEENRALKKRLAARSRATKLIGTSPAMREVKARVHAVADSDSTVLIQGKSGTGKEVVARMIHECSPRQAGPFVPVACAALPESLIESELFGYEAGAFTGAAKARAGRFETAHRGTLFLDDIDDVPMAMQVKLLRAIQERKIERVGSSEERAVDVRIIAATKTDLAELVREKKFREDMFYRLSVVPVHLPPLCDRLDDIPLLTAHFLDLYARKSGIPTPSITPDALEQLCSHSWPGNVRELEHVIEQTLVLNRKETIAAADLPILRPPIDGTSPVLVDLSGKQQVNLAELLAETEARLLRWALDRHQGNLARAAEALGIPRSTLQYKIARLEVDEHEGPQL